MWTYFKNSEDAHHMKDYDNLISTFPYCTGDRNFIFLNFFNQYNSLLQMCEQAAEAHKSKGGGHSSRRSRMSSDSGLANKSSVDAILSNSSSAPLSQVLLVTLFYSYCLILMLKFPSLFSQPLKKS